MGSRVIKGEPAAALAYSYPSPPDATHALTVCANVCAQVVHGEELVLFFERQCALSGCRMHPQGYLAKPANGLVLWCRERNARALVVSTSHIVRIAPV